MKPSLKAAGVAAALTLGATFSAQAERLDADNATICQGQMYGGDYIATFNPTFAPVEPMHFNLPNGEDLVADIQPLSGNAFLITPSNPNRDCDSFMADMKQNGIIQSIEPNWILGIGGPGPDFF